jgi:23S rRNA (cytosine1962-C5)-methyltransferase
MELLIPKGWSDYELIDTGGREKLERFGSYILIRPEPQAVWKKSMPEEEWSELAHARYTRKSGGQGGRGPEVLEERGSWQKQAEMPDQWLIGYQYGEMALKFRLGLTSFGHIGVFPEQAENWRFIYDAIMDGNKLRAQGEESSSHPVIRVLNLFAYTGGASLAARAAGADVVHVDSVKQVISWAREDMGLSRLDGIRWVVEDALKFVRREVKRGNKYDGIILDPPAYGRGPEGEKWALGEYIDEMVSLCSELLRAQGSGHRAQASFFILSLYSMGFSSLIGENLIRSHFGKEVEIQSGEFCFTDRAGRMLPLGIVARASLK